MEMFKSFVVDERPSITSEIYPSPEPAFAKFAGRRSVVHSTKGIVSCTQPLASRAGIKILEQGGNAADAAVATAAALNVTEPSSTGIGGDMFCLYYDAKTKKTRALNGSGRSSLTTTMEELRKNLNIPDGQEGKIPFRKVSAVTVPGAAAGWVDTIEKLGSGKVTLQQVLDPAIQLAEEGFPVSAFVGGWWATGEELMRDASPNFAEMLKPVKTAKDGVRAPRPGEIFKNPNLAKTFRSLAEHGKKGFYEGRIADAIAKVVKDLGGFITTEDLKHHAETGTEEVEPISIKFGGQNIGEPVELWEHPPNGQGLVALIALGLFDQLEKAGKIPLFKAKDHNNVEYLHAVIECLRLAFSDGGRYIADPAKSEVPIPSLLSPEYLSKRCEPFTKDGVLQRIEPGSPAFSKSDTVYLSTSDSQGNACSFINSNYAGFGTGIIPEGCGFTLQNRGAGFTLGPEGHPNLYAPGKRPYHTIIPAMVTRVRDQNLWANYGVMGGYMQPQGHLQVLLNMLVFEMNPQEALDAPRICIEPSGARGIDTAENEEIYLEEGIKDDVIEGLKKLGHNIFVLKDFDRGLFGRGQVIRCHEEDGQVIWSAGSDMRGDGHASPL